MTPRTPPWRRTLRAWTALLALGGAAVAWAAEAGRRFDLPAGDAAATLRRFSEQSGEQIVYPVDRVRGVRTQAVRGTLTPHAALEQMLAGTELRVRRDDETGALAVTRPSAEPRPKPPALARPAPAKPERDEPVRLNVFEVRATPPGSYGALESNALTAFRVELDKLPIAAEVFTKTFIDDIGATTIEELIVNYSGVGGYASSLIDVAPGDRDGAGGVLLRGFVVPALKRDGFVGLRANLRTATGSTDAFAIEHAELLGGPQSLLYGGSGGGGIVNQVSKRAHFNRAATEARASVTTQGGRRATLDFNHGGDAFAVRLAAAAEAARNRRRNLGGRFEGLYLQLAWRIGPGTTLRVWGQRDHSEANHAFAPNLAPFLAVDDPRIGYSARALALTQRLADLAGVTAGGLDYANVESLAGWWASESIRNRFAGLSVESRLKPALSAQLAAIYGETKDNRVAPPMRALLPARGLAGAGLNPFDETAFQVQPSDNDQPHRVKGARLTLVTENSFWRGRAESQTALGLEAVHNTDEDSIDYAYYQADADGRVPFDPTLPDYGRTRLGALYFPVGGGIPRQPLFRPRTARVTIDGVNYVRLPRIYADPARITPQNPTGLIPNNPGVGSGFLGNRSHADTHSAAVFLSNFTRWFDERLTTLAGVRFSRSTALNYGPAAFAYRAPWDTSTTGNLSASFRIAGGWRAFANLSTSYAAIEGTSRDLVGAQLRPVKTRAPLPELGLKYATPDARLGVQLALNPGTTQRDETALVDASYLAAVNPAGLNGAHGTPDRRVNVDRTSRSAELRLVAAPRPGWRLRLSLAGIDGEVRSDVAYRQLYNDQFFANASGGVTYRDGTPLLVDPADPAGENRTAPLTRAMLDDPASPYWANPDPDSGSITNAALRSVLTAVDPVHGRAATGVTGLPLAQIQYRFDDPHAHRGVIPVFRAGEKTTGYNELTLNFQSNVTFGRGPWRGWGAFVDVRTYLRNRGYYVQAIAPGDRPLNGVRELYRLPNATVLNLNLHYTRALGARCSWRSQLNVLNALNHYRAWIVPDPASGQFTRARLSTQPRTLVWTNTFSF